MILIFLSYTQNYHCHRLLILTPKVLKKNEACKAKIAASENFALAVTFFALDVSRPTPQTLPFTHFQHRFTHFQHPITHFQQSATADETAKSVASCTTSYERQSCLIIVKNCHENRHPYPGAPMTNPFIQRILAQKREG